MIWQKSYQPFLHRCLMIIGILIFQQMFGLTFLMKTIHIFLIAKSIQQALEVLLPKILLTFLILCKTHQNMLIKMVILDYFLYSAMVKMLMGKRRMEEVMLYKQVLNITMALNQQLIMI